MGLRSLWQRLRHVPAPVADAGLAVAVGVAAAIAVPMAPLQGARPDALAYALGLTIAALVLVRRRWPLAVLLASAMILQVYYQLGYPSIYPAVPLSVALATTWAAGYFRWSLLVAVFYVGGPIVYRTLVGSDPLLQVLSDELPDAALLTAVLALGEAVRTRRALAMEQERSERLLLNVLPAPIAARLKQTNGVIADALADVTVLFADLVDFTERSQQRTPAQVVQVLNELFSVFDQLAQRHGLERIKTIGDAYMVAGGLPDPRPDHAQAVAEMALAMREEVGRHRDPSGQPLQVRNLVAMGGITVSGAMTASTLAGRRFLAELRSRRAEVEGKLALGATMRQATADLVAVAVAEAPVPALDQTRTTGLVTLPGAFVGACSARPARWRRPVPAGRAGWFAGGRDVAAERRDG